MGDNNQFHQRFSQQIHKQTTSGLLRKLATKLYTPMRGHTLFLILCFGFAGILIDLDHPINEQTQMARPLHLPYWTLVWVAGIGYYASLRRRVHKLGVTEKKG